VSYQRIDTNDELGRMWDGAVMSYFTVLFQHFSGETNENKEKISRRIADIHA
jgi:hypothetical protein